MVEEAASFFQYCINGWSVQGQSLAPLNKQQDPWIASLKKTLNFI